MIKILRKLKRRTKRIGLKYTKPQEKVESISIGTEYGSFTICPEKLNKDSFIYSFGIGEDISFDIGLIELFGCWVYAFGPTPKSIGWLKKQTLPEEFQWFEYGLANCDGNLQFDEPSNPNWVSYTATRKDTDRLKIWLPVRKLSTIMNTFGHTHIDILKMDIEGCEYDVIEDILRSDINIGQILVEFHHRFSEYGKQATYRIIKLLIERGYLLFSISDNGEETSFISQSEII